MWKTALNALLIVAQRAILICLLFILAGQGVFAQHPAGAFINSPIALSSLASKQYLSGKGEESLALYQKAIEKAGEDYGTNSPLVGNLNYEMGVRAYDLCKFDLAEQCLKNAVAINPNGLTAQLMLGQLLRFRNKNSEAYKYAERGLSRNWDASAGRKEMMVCLQDVDPASAARQAFVIHCLENGATNKIPTNEQPVPVRVPAPILPQKPEVTEIKTPTPSTPAEHGLASFAPTVVTTKAPVKKAAPKSTPQKVKTKAKSSKVHKNEHTPSLLVPPPPLIPNWFGFGSPKPKPTAQPAAELKAEAGSIKKNKKQTAATKATDEAAPKTHKETGASSTTKHMPTESDSDFLLDWAGKKAGKK